MSRASTRLYIALPRNLKLTVSALRSGIMSLFEENWQTTRLTIRERAKFMFNNDRFSDVKFVVRKMESQSKYVLPAHKFVLSISSPVFEAMFYGKLPETKDSIELPDCEYESLLELFRYMYSDEVNLNGSNVMGVLYLAKKYVVPSLADKCTDFLQGKLHASDVFSILPRAYHYEEKKLVKGCWRVIDEHSEEAIKSDGFATLERSLIEEVVKRDTLNIEEVELFKAVDSWATKKCKEEGLAADGSVKRKLLGENIVKAIRFPAMKQQDFADVVLDTKILTQDEVSDVVKYFNSVLSSPIGFPVKKRLRTFACCRFENVNNADLSHSYFSRREDCLIFTVDKNLLLLGLTLCGSENNEYNVIIRIIKLGGFNECVNSMSGQFPSVLIEEELHSFYGFKILFGDPNVIEKGIEHRIEASIFGANSCSGRNGQKVVACSGLKFSFADSSEDTNGTGVAKGQFPELLFRTM